MAKVNNDVIWNDYVKTGKVAGFSLEGLFGHNLVEASKQAHLTSLSALADDFDNEFAEEMLASIKGIIKKDNRLKDGQRVEMETYSDYPDAVKNNAQKGIDLNKKVNNRCATEVGKIRAQQLANGRNISVQTIKRMYAYLSRAEAFYDDKDMQACGTISFLLWGGKAGKAWSAAKLKELGLFQGETAVSVGSSYAGQFGPGKKKYKAPAQLAVECPEATQDIAINLANRQIAIDQANYGPLNPNEPNEEYWQAKADQFGGDVVAAKKALCGNCAFFDIRKQTLACIETGIGEEDDPELVIEAGQLGYCEAFDFKCAASRTCDAWVVGGPITDEVELAEYEQGPCQAGYVQIGMKDKDGRMVPNCVPEDKVGK
jgi:hypothetical protein